MLSLVIQLAQRELRLITTRSSPVRVPNVPVDPRRTLTLPTKQGTTSSLAVRVLTFPRAIFPNASNDSTPGVGDNCRKDYQPTKPVLGAAALAILPAPISKPVQRPFPLARDNLTERELETIGGILPAFAREHLERVEGASASASEIFAAPQVWCSEH